MTHGPSVPSRAQLIGPFSGISVIEEDFADGLSIASAPAYLQYLAWCLNKFNRGPLDRPRVTQRIAISHRIISQGWYCPSGLPSCFKRRLMRNECRQAPESQRRRLSATH